MRRKIFTTFAVLVGIAFVGLLASYATGFSTWPWQQVHQYSDGDLGLRIGAEKSEVWTRVLALGDAGQLMPRFGDNNDSRATTTELSQVESMDSWRFPFPPCCNCSLDMKFKSGKLEHFERHCNYAPEGT